MIRDNLKYKIELLPIKQPLFEEKTNIEELVDKVLTFKKQDSSYDTNDLESQIDRLVYDLYGLTEDEIKIIEGK